MASAGVICHRVYPYRLKARLFRWPQALMQAQGLARLHGGEFAIASGPEATTASRMGG